MPPRAPQPTLLLGPDDPPRSRRSERLRPDDVNAPALALIARARLRRKMSTIVGVTFGSALIRVLPTARCAGSGAFLYDARHGNQSVKAAPRPGAVSSSTRPPCRRANA